MKEHWAIIGGGNGGQAFAAYLSMEGLDITLYDIFLRRQQTGRHSS
ncbi:MAG: NAD(P)-binding protein [Christensenellales bacterium]